MKSKTVSCLEDFYYAGKNSNYSAIKTMIGMGIATGMVCFGWGMMVGVYGIFKAALFLMA